jgi:MFS family permease
MKMSQAGAFMSAFEIGCLVTQVPAGALADRFGAPVILSISLLIAGITTFAMGSIGSFGPGFVLRLITGIALGAD